MGKVTIYPGGNGYDIIAPDASGGYWQILAFKATEFAKYIRRRPLKIKSTEFIPGKVYTEFGNGRKTSAGFIEYRGQPITFVGTYGENALFESEGGPFEDMEYPVCYWSWKILGEREAFFATTSKQSGRVMEFD